MISLDQAAAMQFDDYNPNTVIQVVNALQPGGKEATLNQIEAVLKNHPNEDNYGLFWVLRVLFDVPAGEEFPPVRIGQPTIPPPSDSRQFPRFPVVLIRDIPFLVVSGYALGGLPESAQVHVDYFRSHGTWRGSPLAPPSSLSSVKEEFSQQWKAVYGNAHAAEVMSLIDAQLARLSK